ncbi:MAG: LacI family DNA-binding transcriptional regulator, partial [Bryobacteraceae bacterium]
MATRLKDIARDVGVSVVTVSKVLRNHTDISIETRDRVLKRIEELNYQPNLAARALVTGRSQLAGLVVPDLVHPFFAELAKGISSVLRTRGYGLVIASSEEDPDLERQEIGQMLARRLDVLLIASTQWTVETFRKIEEQHRPYLLVDRKFSGMAANFVGSDDFEVGRMATEHLIQNGC